MNGRAEPNHLQVWIGLCLIGLLFILIARRVVDTGMAESLSRSDPRSALQWQSGNSEALLRRFAGPASTGADATEQIDIAKAGLRAAPLDARGYRLLAQQAEARNDQVRAERLYRLAGARGPRDIPSLGWLVNLELNRGDYVAAFAHIDQMFRVQPELRSKLSPLLVTLLDKEPVQEQMANLLQKAPPWRSFFLPELIRRNRNSAALFAVVEHLRLTPPGLSKEELSAWINRLAAEQQWGAAYLIWVQSLPAEARKHIGNVFNGGFEWEPSNTGFDWRVTHVPGAFVSQAQVAGTGDDLALRVEFDDRRVLFHHVSQLLALTPGAYKLQGRARLDDLRTERGLVWTLTCVESGKDIAETLPMSGRHNWAPFETGFVVPPQSCGGQRLVLRNPARIPSERLIGGTAWFDDLQVQADTP